MAKALARRSKSLPSEKPGAEILNHLFIAVAELMEDQARHWQRSARRAHANDWGPKIAEALGSSGERSSATAINGYVTMCERCANNLTDAAGKIRALHMNLKRQGLCIES